MGNSDQLILFGSMITYFCVKSGQNMFSRSGSVISEVDAFNKGKLL